MQQPYKMKLLFVHHKKPCWTAGRDSCSPEAAVPVGPHCPDWIRQASHLPEDTTTRHQHADGNYKARHKADSQNLSARSKGIRKERKSKSDKKAKKKKKHKHKSME